MKKLRLQTVAVVLFTATTLMSCSKDDEGNTVTKTEFVTNVTGATTATVNQEVPLNVTYHVDGTCGVFDKTVESTTGNTTTIEVKVKYATQVCSGPTTQTLAYKFKKATAGTYILKFKKSATEFITQTIVVN